MHACPIACSFLLRAAAPAPAQVCEACRGLTSYEALCSSPDLVDDVFLLAMRALGYAPRLLLGQVGSAPHRAARP